MNALRASFTSLHSQDYGCCAGYCIAACVNSLFTGLASSLFGYDTFSLVDLKTFGGVGDQWVWRSTSGHDNRVYIHHKLGTWDGHRSSSAGCIWLA